MRVLVFSECPNLPTSMGKVLYVIVKYLRRKHRIYCSCVAGQRQINAYGYVWEPRSACYDPLLKDWERGLCEKVSFDGRVPIYPWVDGGELRLIRDVDPDVILLYGTPYDGGFIKLINTLGNARKEGKLDAVIVGYFISEVLYMPPHFGMHALGVDYLTTPTRFTLNTFIDSFNRFKDGLGGKVLKSGRVKVIPHGINLSFYNKSNLKYGRRLIKDKFVFGTFCKNHIRKNVGALLRAFAGLPDDVRGGSMVFLPLIKYGSAPIWNIDAVISAVESEYKVGLDDKVVCLPEDVELSGVTEYFLLTVYRSIDLFVFPSIGESFGLPPVEAGAFGLPVVLTGHPALKEVWEGYPEDAFIRCRSFITGDGYILCDPLVDSLRDVLLKVFRDSRFREELSVKALEIARRYPEEVLGEGMLKAVDDALSLGEGLLKGL